ncbi:MAG: hypothetical protein JO227_07665, partial [Acetobacteraceae bacterium]|nr:hypothetical protein [Acetobacteraceae bacterium]
MAPLDRNYVRHAATRWVASRCSGRLHYAWITLAIAFGVTAAAVGVRAAPAVIMVPLQKSFGWDVGTISAAISLNILLLGVLGPFVTGLIDVI